jgi:hypothetical protein
MLPQFLDVHSLESCALRFAVIRSRIERVAMLLLVVGLCAMVVHKYGGVAMILGAGFISAIVSLPIALYKGVLVPLLRGVQCPTCHE